MSKFRHLGSHVQTLIGYGPVAPGEVIETDLKLGGNFELVEEPVPPTVVAEDVVEPVVADVVVKSKKNAEPVNDTPAEPEVEA